MQLTVFAKLQWMQLLPIALFIETFLAQQQYTPHSTLARRSPEVFNSVEKIVKPLIVDCSSSSLIAADPFSN